MRFLLILCILLIIGCESPIADPVVSATMRFEVMLMPSGNEFNSSHDIEIHITLTNNSKEDQWIYQYETGRASACFELLDANGNVIPPSNESYWIHSDLDSIVLYPGSKQDYFLDLDDFPALQKGVYTLKYVTLDCEPLEFEIVGNYSPTL